MKIGIVQPVIGNIGGNDRVLKSLIEILKGHEIILFTFSNSEKKYEGIEVRNKIPKKIPVLGIYQKFLMGQHDYSDCDIIISATGFPVKTTKPVIIYDQNNLSNDFTRTTPKKYKKGFWRIYYQPYRLMNRIQNRKGFKAKFIANSKYSAKKLSSALKVKIDVIYPAVDSSEFYTGKKERKICVVGRISPEKNLEESIEILNRVGYPSVIFGNVTISTTLYYKQIKKLCNSNVKIVVNRPRTELIDLLATSKVFLTSSKETFGIAVVESIASGCIPIVPDNSAHPETVPIDHLRYGSIKDAVTKLHVAMSGEHDMVVDELQNYIKQFDTSRFKDRIEMYINNVKESK